jgi:hypothetical protein
MSDGILSARVVWKGQVLKPDVSLSEAGVKENDKLLILPGERQAKVLDVLAMYLFLMSSNEEEFIRMMSLKDSRFDDFRETLNSMGEELHGLTSGDVADNLRAAMDVAYHRVRAWWERPAFRRWLHDPDQIEEKRQVFRTNLSPNILKHTSPLFQEAVQSKEVWRREFVKVTSNLLRLGDTILDGILELLLDVLKGKGTRRHDAHAGSDVSSSPSNSGVSSGPRMDDPSLANNLLDELSESDGDDDDK